MTGVTIMAKKSINYMDYTQGLDCKIDHMLSYDEVRSLIMEKNVYAAAAELSPNEMLLDDHLREMKKRCINSKTNYCINMLTDEKMRSSELYRFCKKLPKGSDLHVHGLAPLPVRELIQFLRMRDDVEICTEDGDDKYVLFMSDDDERPMGCMKLEKALQKKLMTEDELIRKWSVLSADENGNIWDHFENLFRCHQVLGQDMKLLEDYYEAAFRYYRMQNIIHIEVRHLFFGTNEEAADTARAIRSAYYKVRDDYPDFIASVFGAALKHKDLQKNVAKTLIDNAMYIHENVKDEYEEDNICNFLVGIDLVNEEDNSRPLEYYRTLIERVKLRCPEMKLTLHAGESYRLENTAVFDAYLNGASRVGHALTLWRYPDLLERYKRKNICIEVCPISNSALGYVRDIRFHPAAEYLKRGLNVVLGSDDPAYFEYSALTDDFFAAVICWDLTISEIKLLCMNSITYSSLCDDHKNFLFKRWRESWESFISEIVPPEELVPVKKPQFVTVKANPFNAVPAPETLDLSNEE